MLSVASVKSAGGAASYLAKDDFQNEAGEGAGVGEGGGGGPGEGGGGGGSGEGGGASSYYASEKESAAGEWGGKGGAALGLTGAPTKESLGAILKGELPDGTAVRADGEKRPGMELTFSMSKSASILAYVGGDKRILVAHMEAVKTTMAFVEKQFAEARTGPREGRQVVQTGNLVYGLFPHDTSRAQDPQGHIHAVIANMTQMPDGSWKALHNDALWKNNTTIGAAYHAAFRSKLEELGCETKITGKHGAFEIVGVPQKAIDEFSIRRGEILQKAAELGATNHATLDKITTMTRDPKLGVENRETLLQHWRDRASAIGFDPKPMIETARARAGELKLGSPMATAAAFSSVVGQIKEALGSIFTPHDPLVTRSRLTSTAEQYRTQSAVASAVRMLSQREAAFSVNDLTTKAVNLGLSGVTVERAEQRVSELIRKGLLVPGVSDRSDGLVTHVTTPAAMASEQRILDGVNQGRGAAVPVVPADTVAQRLQAVAGAQPLNNGQLAAASLALASRDRVTAVQGVAGAGKSTMIAAVARVAEQEGKEVLGLAFQNKMLRDLSDGAVVEAKTVSSFVNAHIRGARGGKSEASSRAALAGKILVLDEASMVSNQGLERLIEIANKFDVRLVMVGDRQQLQPIDAGKSFSLTQAGGVTMERMDTNLRQRTDQLRAVAAMTNTGNVRGAMQLLGDKVINADDRVDAAAKHWLGLPSEERERTAIFSSGKHSREGLNIAVQDGLKAEGTLKGEGVTLTVLSAVTETREEMRYRDTYKPGQVLDVVRNTQGLPLARGRYEVTDVSKKGVTVRDELGREKRFNPTKIDPKDDRDGLRLSEKEQIRLHEGDKIRWTDNDKARGLDKSALAQVAGVDSKGITVETSSREMVRLNHGDKMLQQLGLAYALNMHMAQGITTDKGIVVMGSQERNLSNQRLLNVAVTRVRDDVALYTDDKDRLTRTIEQNPGNKTSALEVTGKIQIDAPTRHSGLSGGAGGSASPRPASEFNPTLPAELNKGPETTGSGGGKSDSSSGPSQSASNSGASKSPSSNSKPGLDLGKDTASYGPRESPLPLPTKDLGLEL